MTENNLFQFAQVIAELPLHNSGQNEAHINQFGHRYLPVRKNACIVCSICFTCSKYYGVDCTCQEIQPRRGKNLPEGGLDSRAKKLHPKDRDDYEFSIKWINENAHSIYKNQHDQVVGLEELAEVSLCKAHSSTLYRAKKRHERSKGQAPPSPADSNGLDDHSHTNYHKTSPFINPYPTHENAAAAPASSGGLAAKVRELAYQPPPQPFRVHEAPDFTRISHSNSGKRKRSSKQRSPEPLSSASTPIYTSSRPNQFTLTAQVHEQPPFHSMHSIQQQALPPPFPLPQSQQQQQVHQQQQQQLQQSQSFSQSHIKQDHQQQQQQLQQHQSFSQTQIKPDSQQFTDSYSSQLPPLQSKSHSYSASISYSSLPLTQGYPTARVSPVTTVGATNMGGMVGDPVPTLIPQPNYQPQPHLVVETVSLRSIPSPDIPSMYYFRNLAITDSFKFRDLLAEIDIQGNPPPGKRIVISDASNERIYPLDQPIQSTIKRPTSAHVELCLGLSDQPSINWSEYPSSSPS